MMEIRKKEKTGLYYGVVAAIGCAVLAGIMLFLSPVLGVADDGTLGEVIKGAGLAYPEGSEAGPDYLVGTYVWETNEGTGYRSLQTGVIWLAKLLDRMVTHDRIFDLRFLGLICLILYLPALFLLVKAAADRLPKRSQQIVITVLSVLIFADVGYVTYFNSFYPESLVLICLLYLAGAAMNLQRESGWESVWLLIFTAAGIALCFVRHYCFLTGVVCALFCFFRFRDQKDTRWNLLVVLCGVTLTAASLSSWYILQDDFNKADSLHAITRGVLLYAENPEEALGEFGIDPSYSLLADASAYDAFPAVTGYEPILEEEFYAHYNSLDVARYYVRHPGQLLYMLDSAVRTNLQVRREYCGNYEQSADRPAGSRSVFWSAYSIFKDRSAPKTIGYFIVLAALPFVLTVSLKRGASRKNKVFSELVAALALLALVQTCYVVIRCGETALGQYNGQLGMIMDILFLAAVTELLERLNIL